MRFDPQITGKERSNAIAQLTADGRERDDVTEGMIIAQITHNRGLKVIDTVRYHAEPNTMLPGRTSVIGTYTDGFGVQHEVKLFTEGNSRRVYIGDGHLNKYLSRHARTFSDLDGELSGLG